MGKMAMPNCSLSPPQQGRKRAAYGQVRQESGVRRSRRDRTADPSSDCTGRLPSSDPLASYRQQISRVAGDDRRQRKRRQQASVVLLLPQGGEAHLHLSAAADLPVLLPPATRRIARRVLTTSVEKNRRR